MSERVLDASALLALLQEETGSDYVAQVLPKAVICSVNMSEVVSKLVEKGVPASAVRQTLAGLDIDERPFDHELACSAGELRWVTAAYGLSLGDRACLALARHLSAPALTSDGVWKELMISGVSVELFR